MDYESDYSSLGQNAAEGSVLGLVPWAEGSGVATGQSCGLDSVPDVGTSIC